MSDDNITRIPVKFRDPQKHGDTSLVLVETMFDRKACNHRYRFENGKTREAQYLIREGETEVECGLCETKLDPMFVLRILAGEESQWVRNRERYLDEMKRLSGRSKTTCQHCGQMTRISRS